MAFPDYEQLTAKMANHGLTDLRYYPFTFGIATLYVGEKPNPVVGPEATAKTAE